MATATTAPSLSWGYCPEELLRIIFKQLSLKELVSCMLVNRRWKDIAVDFIEFHCLWLKIISEIMANKGLTYHRKSVLSYKDIFMNSLLWPFIQRSRIKLHHTYALENIKAIHTYKDNLILIGGLPSNAEVKYFNIPKMEQIRAFKSTANVIDYTENDYMVVTFGTDFCAYGKRTPDDTCINKHLIYFMDDVYLFRLEDNICYVVTHRNVIYALVWTKSYKWEIKSRGRYYGNVNDRINELNVFDGKICMVTKLGFIVCENLGLKSFHKVNSYNCEPRLENSSIMVLFNDEKGVSVAVHNSYRSEEVFEKFKSNFVVIKCKDMTCATEHGEIIFVGYRDGAVGICTIHKMPQGEPECLLYVQDFDNTIDEPAILSLEVFEDKLSHHLFVGTRHKVLQLLITYPDDVAACYE